MILKRTSILPDSQIHNLKHSRILFWLGNIHQGGIHTFIVPAKIARRKPRSFFVVNLRDNVAQTYILKLRIDDVNVYFPCLHAVKQYLADFMLKTEVYIIRDTVPCFVQISGGIISQSSKVIVLPVALRNIFHECIQLIHEGSFQFRKTVKIRDADNF